MLPKRSAANMTLMERAPGLCEQVPALGGHRVGITADRRAEEQGELLRRMGAQVVFGPVLRTLPLADDTPMREATEALLDAPPDMVLLTTGIGVRSWVGAAETWGLADRLVELLTNVPVYARGPKAYAAALSLGVPVWRREPTERLEAMIDAITTEGVAGKHIAIQLYGNDAPWAVKALDEAGARVTAVPIYRWVPPDDEGPARRLVREALDGQLTVMTFTSPSAVVSTCRIAEAEQSLDALLEVYNTRVIAACVGPVTEAAARDRGMKVACAPAVGRLGLLVRALAAAVRERHVHLQTPQGEVLLQGNLVVSNDAQVLLPDRERQVLAVLARRPGVVTSRATIEREVWRSDDEDRALDAVLSRLRRHLLPTGLQIVTRVRRGYQLLGEPMSCPVAGEPARGTKSA